MAACHISTCSSGSVDGVWVEGFIASSVSEYFITALVKELVSSFLGSCRGKPLIPVCLESWTSTAMFTMP